ncbi:exopolysaccharide production repressor protein [Mesorhizobium onobrychidis]|uniref:exopolysaccharide production repressor protein n=2 Tax=Mesorhizobium TaxID=68287 RepID=UPI0021572CC5|nr:exopolysaccharide production repressor protein [Mesorhizobium onobrychidis]
MIWRTNQENALHFISFCRLLGLVLCSNALIVYFAADSIRLAVVTTLACSLLLQVGYFGSVLFSIWRSSRACTARHRGHHVDGFKEARYQSPDSDQLRNQISAVSQLPSIALLLWGAVARAVLSRHHFGSL